MSELEEQLVGTLVPLRFSSVVPKCRLPSICPVVWWGGGRGGTTVQHESEHECFLSQRKYQKHGVGIQDVVWRDSRESGRPSLTLCFWLVVLWGHVHLIQ